MEKKLQETEVLKALVKITRYIIFVSLLLVIGILTFVGSTFSGRGESAEAEVTISPGSPVFASTQTLPAKNMEKSIPADTWKAPDVSTIPAGKKGDMIRYGKDLLAHTAEYFGPKGSIAQITNGMNCQNCHLDAGTRIYGNNYASFI
ncbi:MAG: cytochrome C, partial [Sphingobacteriaceae bacterium]